MAYAETSEAPQAVLTLSARVDLMALGQPRRHPPRGMGCLSLGGGMAADRMMELSMG